MYKTSIKLKFSKLDQENLEEKWINGVNSALEICFFFRGYGEVVDEANMGSVNGMDGDIEVLFDELYFGSYYKVV